MDASIWYNYTSWSCGRRRGRLLMIIHHVIEGVGRVLLNKKMYWLHFFSNTQCLWKKIHRQPWFFSTDTVRAKIQLFKNRHKNFINLYTKLILSKRKFVHIQKYVTLQKEMWTLLTGCQLGTNWAPTGYQLGTNWVPTGYQLGTNWVPTGYQLGTNWVPTGYQHLLQD